jgi:Trk K+ transport system NAD-binding subunit
MNTAIVGLGTIGLRVAKNLTSGGEKVIVADRTRKRRSCLRASFSCLRAAGKGPNLSWPKFNLTK